MSFKNPINVSTSAFSASNDSFYVSISYRDWVLHRHFDAKNRELVNNIKLTSSSKILDSLKGTFSEQVNLPLRFGINHAKDVMGLDPTYIEKMIVDNRFTTTFEIRTSISFDDQTKIDSVDDWYVMEMMFNLKYFRSNLIKFARGEIKQNPNVTFEEVFNKYYQSQGYSLMIEKLTN
jgi:hypothetical protein